MSSFQTDIPTMDVAAGRVFEVNDQVQAELAALLQRLDPLMSAWQGSAATSFHQLKDRWHESATRMNQALRSIGEGLVQVRRNYVSSEDTNQQGFTGLAGGLE